MAEQDEQGLVIVGSDGTEHEFPTGMDPQKAAGIVREQEAFAKSGPMVRSRTGQMYRHPTEGVSKDFISGAASAVDPRNYIEMAKTALTQNPAKTAMDAAEGLIKLPFRLAGGMITEPARTLGAMTAGTAAGELLPVAPKPIARGLGNALEKAGTKAEWPMQVAASHQILSGNPGGLAVMAVPPILRKVGRGLQDFGTSAEMLKADADAMLQRGAPAPKPSIRVTPPVKDLYKVAQENAAEGAAVKAAPQAGNTSAAEIARMRAQGMSDETIAKVIARDPGVKQDIAPVLSGGPSRPSIRVTGKAATDLAEGKVAPAPPAGPPSTLQDLAKKVGTGVDMDAEVESLQRQTENASRLANRNGVVPADVRKLNGEWTPEAWKAFVKKDLSPNTDIAAQMAEDEAHRTLSPQDASRFSSGVDRVLDKYDGGTPISQAVRAEFGLDAPKPARIATQEAIPASKSKGAMSGTPGLTRTDLEAVGLNPDLHYKDLTPEMVDRIKAMRSARHGTHHTNAQADKSIRSMLEDSLLFQHMDRLR